MKSARSGTITSEVGVTGITPFGIWLLLREEEKFLPLEHFPWFRDATVAQICAVERPSEQHLYWPELDIGLAVESIDHPGRFPLVAKSARDDPAPGRRPATSTVGG